MQVQKVYQVLVMAYHKQEVPKHTKYFNTESEALTHKDVLSGYLWNTAVSFEVKPVYVVDDGTTKFLLNGNFVTLG